LRERYFGNARLLAEDTKMRLLARKAWPSGADDRGLEPAHPAPATAVTSPLYDLGESLGYDDITMMQHVDLHTWLPGDILAKADRMTMAHSLELRVPFLDHEVFRLAASLPSDLRVQGAVTKPFLRRAFADLLPPRAAMRPKRGFPVPTREWLRGPLAGELKELLGDPSLDRYLNRRAVEGLVQAHLSGREDTSRPLFALTVFALWESMFLRETTIHTSVAPLHTRSSAAMQPVPALAAGWS
jgi:asparagine synthase (glutamine-hydrolysing)